MTAINEGREPQGWIADDSTFGARLALIRQRMQWGNVKEAAAACGLPTESWRTWERDGVTPRRVVEIAAIISERTGCDYGWLLAGSRLSNPPQGGSRSEATTRYPGSAEQPTADRTVRTAPARAPQPKRRPKAVTSPGRGTPKDATRRPAIVPRLVRA